jgi:hypothetical protein
MANHIGLTLEEIQFSQRRFCTSRALQGAHTPRNLLFSLTSQVGELCEAFQWRPDAPTGLPNWTDRERMNVASKLATIILITARMADQCHIELAPAVLAVQDKQAREMPETVPVLIQLASTPPRPQSLHPDAPPDLSQTMQPTTEDEMFWNMICMVETINTPGGEVYTEQMFAHLRLRFIIVNNGHEVELIPDGKNTPVTLATKDRYTRMARERKRQIDNGSLASFHAVTDQAEFRHQPLQQSSSIREIPLVVPNENFDPAKVKAKFSPTHFTKGILSPHLASNSVAVDFSEEGARRSLPKSVSQQILLGNATPPQQALHIPDPLSPATPPPSAPQPSQPPPPPLAESALGEFWRMLDDFEVGSFSEEDLEAMSVRFVVPYKGTHVELIPSGRNIRVTNATKAKFVRLARQQARALGGDASSGAKKPSLCRSLSVQVAPSKSWDPTSEIRHFSPSHFKVDLFSPYTTQTVFDNISTQGRKLALVPEDHITHPQPKSNQGMLSMESQFPALLDSLDLVNKPGGDEFTPESFSALKITFCVPFQGKCVDVMVGGADIPVTLDRLSEYIMLARAKLHELNASQMT